MTGCRDNASLVRIGSLCDLLNGRAFKPSDWTPSGLPIVRIQNLNNHDAPFNRFDGEVRQRFLIDSGALLFAWSGTPGTSFGAHLWNGGKAILNQHIFNVVFDEERINKRFFYFALNQKVGELIGKAHGGVGLQHVTKGVIEDTMIFLPPIDEQCRIVDLLSRAEGIVRLRREAQVKAQAIIPALFLDVFGDPATNPKGWPVVTLGEALRAADYGSSTKASEDAAGLPLIRMGNVTYAGDLDLSDLKYVELEPTEVDRFRLEHGDILFNRTNSKELVGKTGLWDVDLDAVAASYFIRLRAREGVRPFYVWAFMNSRHMKRVLFDTARGAIGQSNINSKELKAFRLPLPPVDAQARFEERCRSVLGIVAQQTEALKKAEAVFQSLLACTFSSNPATAAAVAEEAAVA